MSCCDSVNWTFCYSVIVVNHVILWQCELNLLLQLNLASQSVLEGLNACLDHRGEVFIPELGETFYIQSDSTRLFGAQNPLRQGGARRGLPQSFLNRFTQVSSCDCTVFIVNCAENCEEDYCHLGCAAALCSEWLMAFLQNIANHIHSYALSPSRMQNAQLHHAENLKTCIDDKFYALMLCMGRLYQVMKHTQAVISEWVVTVVFLLHTSLIYYASV
jgi:hypothetical protein